MIRSNNHPLDWSLIIRLAMEDGSRLGRRYKEGAYDKALSFAYENYTVWNSEEIGDGVADILDKNISSIRGYLKMPWGTQVKVAA